jgi:tRNA threonylcarbamoyladenosine biosynthesis protein TsaB
VILAIDTSTSQAGVGLLNGDAIEGELLWMAQGNHSRTLSDAIVNLLALCAVELSGISAVVVASGPGSFSGLRVGISEAKGLSLALDVPLVGVSTLDSSAFQSAGSAPRVWAVLSAGRGQLFAAAYGGGVAEFHRQGDYGLFTLEEAASTVDGLVTGEGADQLARISDSITVEPPEWRLRRPGFLAKLGKRYLDAGGRDQRDTLEPLYLRRSAAEEKRMGRTH